VTDPRPINRGAVILEPTDEYLRWAKNAPDPMPDLTLATLQDEAHVYLIPQFDFGGDSEAWLQSNYLPMFEEELQSWCTDEDSWPEDLSYENFRTFFSVHITSLIFDLGRGPLHHEN